MARCRYGDKKAVAAFRDRPLIILVSIVLFRCDSLERRTAVKSWGITGGICGYPTLARALSGWNGTGDRSAGGRIGAASCEELSRVRLQCSSLVERLSIEKRKLEERVAAQSQRTAQLETELESARNAAKDAQVGLHTLAETKGTVEKLEQDRFFTLQETGGSVSDIARALAILKPDSKEHLPSAVTYTANLAT